MDVRGIEVVLNATPVRNTDVTWDVSFNLGYNKRKITNLLKYQDPNFKGIDWQNWNPALREHCSTGLLFF